jgi:hypothetical protein
MNEVRIAKRVIIAAAVVVTAASCGAGSPSMPGDRNEALGAEQAFNPDPCGMMGSITVTLNGRAVASAGAQGESGRSAPASASRQRAADLLVGYDSRNGDLRAVSAYVFKAPDGQNAVGDVASGQQPESILYKTTSNQKSNGRVKLRLDWAQSRQLEPGDYDLMIEATVAARDGSCPGPDQVSVEVVPLVID